MANDFFRDIAEDRAFLVDFVVAAAMGGGRGGPARPPCRREHPEAFLRAFRPLLEIIIRLFQLFPKSSPRDAA